VTVSAGAVVLQGPAAHAATTRYGTPSTAPTGSATTTVAAGGTLEGAGLGATTAGVNLVAAEAANAKKAEAERSERSTAQRPSGKKPGSGLSRVARQRLRASRAVAAAKAKIGAPYRYGGTGPRSFDCSGFVQYAWRKAGVRIPRVTTAQYRGIRTKVSWNNLRPGDLLFFNGKGHVGMYVGKGRMIHSPSSGKRVRIDKLSAWRRANFSGAVRPGL